MDPRVAALTRLVEDDAASVAELVNFYRDNAGNDINFMLFIQDLPIKICDNKILLNVKVTPKASSNKIGKIFNNCLKIYVTAAPEAGQANKVVIELLADLLKISKNSIFITQGLTSQNKIISLTGDNENLVKRLQIIISN